MPTSSSAREGRDSPSSRAIRTISGGSIPPCRSWWSELFAPASFSQRRRELGVRAALDADRSDLIALVEYSSVSPPAVTAEARRSLDEERQRSATRVPVVMNDTSASISFGVSSRSGIVHGEEPAGRVAAAAGSASSLAR